jgi:hypothetical protein
MEKDSRCTNSADLIRVLNFEGFDVGLSRSEIYSADKQGTPGISDNQRNST